MLSNTTRSSVRRLLWCLISILASATMANAQIDGPLDLTYPNGGENFPARSKVNIRWSGVDDGGNDSVRLEYTINGGSSWSTIVDITGGDSSYQWTLPNVASMHCKVRMTQVRGYIGTVDSTAMIATDGGGGTGIRFSRDGRRMVRILSRSTTDFDITVWDVATGALLRTFGFKTRVSLTPTFDPTGERIIVALRNGDTGRVELWNVATGIREAFFNAPWNPRYPQIRNDIRDIAVNPDGTEIAIAARTMLIFWNPVTGALVDTIDQIELMDVEYSENGERFMWRGASTSMTELNAKTHAEIRTIPGSFTVGTFSRDLRWFLTNDSTGKELVLWDMKSGTIARTKKGQDPSAGVQGTLSSDGRYILYWQTGGESIRVHDIYHNSEIVRISQGATYAAIFDPLVERVATLTSTTGAVTLWPVQHVDESEGEFTITNPLPTLATISFDSLKVGAFHDTTLQAHVRNTGSGPMEIQNIAIASGDTADFAITAGAGGAVIEPGASHAITVRFSPKDVGPRSAWLEVNTSSGAIAGELRGIGLRGFFKPTITGIDFEAILVGDSVERVVAIIRNEGNAPLRIDSINPTGLSRTSFVVVEGSTGEVAPGATHQVKVRFKPQYGGQISSSLVTYDEYGRGYSIAMTGEGLLQTDVPLDPISPGVSRLVQNIVPNPISTSARVDCQFRIAAQLRIQLLDVRGQRVADYDLGHAEPGHQEVRLDLSGIPSGAYVLLLLHGEEHEAHTVTVVR